MIVQLSSFVLSPSLKETMIQKLEDGESLFQIQEWLTKIALQKLNTLDEVNMIAKDCNHEKEK